MKFLLILTCFALAKGEILLGGLSYDSSLLRSYLGTPSPWIPGSDAKIIKIDDKFLIAPENIFRSYLDPIIKYNNPIVKSHIEDKPILVSSKAAFYHAQDSAGKTIYGQKEDFQTQEVVQDHAGNKIGSFSYVTPEGKIISTSYVADSNGFQAVGNAVPKDLPEVQSAKFAHLAEVEKIKNRSKRQVVGYSGLGQTWGNFDQAQFNYPASQFYI